VEKYPTVRQATGDNLMWHVCVACWIT
jgi:hypothetical protein